MTSTGSGAAPQVTTRSDDPYRRHLEQLATKLGRNTGSTVVVVSSGTGRLLLLGDVVHCPAQLLEDEWLVLGDVDPQLAQRTRDTLAREIESTGARVGAAHFPGLRFGRLLPAQGRRAWTLA